MKAAMKFCYTGSAGFQDDSLSASEAMYPISGRGVRHQISMSLSPPTSQEQIGKAYQCHPQAIRIR